MAHVEVFKKELHLAGLDFGNIQNVIDERQQVPARLRDAVEIAQGFSLSLALRQRLQELAVADDGIQRRPQLVAHVGQERAFDPVGLHRLLVQ